MRLSLPLLLLICGFGACPGAQAQRPGGVAGGPSGGAQARQLVRQVLGGRDYQVDLPGRSTGSTGSGSTGSRTPPPARPPRPRQYRRGRSGGGGLGLSGGDSMIFYVLIGIGVLVLGAIIISSIRSRDRDVSVRPASSRGGETTPTLQWTRGAIETAADLATQGRYAEAIRILLVGSFDGLHRGQAIAIDRGLTSREILASARLLESQRHALRDIVGAVERSVFARRGASAEDYSAAVESYERLLSTGEAAE